MQYFLLCAAIILEISEGQISMILERNHLAPGCSAKPDKVKPLRYKRVAQIQKGAKRVSISPNILSSQSGRLWLLPILSVCVCLCVCLCVCPAFTADISVTMGWILIKLGGNVGTQVRLIVLKFEHSAAKGNTTHKR